MVRRDAYLHDTGGFVLLCLGPRKDGSTSFHMMPYYCSTALRERHEAGLKKFLTGKSCIKFKRFVDLPDGAIEDIVSNGVVGLKRVVKERGKPVRV